MHLNRRRSLDRDPRVDIRILPDGDLWGPGRQCTVAPEVEKGVGSELPENSGESGLLPHCPKRKRAEGRMKDGSDIHGVGAIGGRLARTQQREIGGRTFPSHRGREISGNRDATADRLAQRVDCDRLRGHRDQNR